jgi:hypothetical protein
MDGRKGGERKQTERQTDRQIKRDVCQKETEGKNARKNSEIPYTMYKIILRYMQLNCTGTVFRTYPLHCYKEKYPFCSYNKVFDLWTSAEFHLFLKTQLSRVFETSHDHIIFLGP